jgi:hypothetical protein
VRMKGEVRNDSIKDNCSIKMTLKVLLYIRQQI